MDKPNLTIIDCDSIIWIGTHNKKDEPEKSLQECKDKCDEIIDNILYATNAEYYLTCFTVHSSKCFRIKYYPAYKQNRLGKELPKYFLDVKNYLMFNSKHSKSVMYTTGEVTYEADDLVLTYYRKYEDTYNCLIASPDKDIKGLNVRVYDYKKLEYNNPNAFMEVYNLFFDMIAGQPGDGIKGIPKLGDKAAINILGNSTETELATKTLNAYIRTMGIDKGIEEFYATYKALKIIDNYSGSKTEPVKV